MPLLISLASGCTNIQYQLAAPHHENINHTISRSELLDHTDHTLKHLNTEKTVLYHQNFSENSALLSFWGGVALVSAAIIGPLAGPFGEAYIMNDIEQKTEQDVAEIKNTIKFDPEKLFAESIDIIPELRLVEYEDQNQVTRISPYIYITNSNNDELLFSAAIIVQDNENSVSQWQGQYIYQLPLSLFKIDVKNGLTHSQIKKIEEEFKEGFKYVSELYLSDRSGMLHDQYKIKVSSNFLSPRFDFSIPAQLIKKDDLSVIIRASNAVYVLPRIRTKINDS